MPPMLSSTSKLSFSKALQHTDQSGCACRLKWDTSSSWRWSRSLTGSSYIDSTYLRPENQPVKELQHLCLRRMNLHEAANQSVDRQTFEHCQHPVFVRYTAAGVHSTAQQPQLRLQMAMCSFTSKCALILIPKRRLLPCKDAQLQHKTQRPTPNAARSVGCSLSLCSAPWSLQPRTPTL